VTASQHLYQGFNGLFWVNGPYQPNLDILDPPSSTAVVVNNDAITGIGAATLAALTSEEELLCHLGDSSEDEEELTSL
jgi:hypothetical protein